MSSASSLALSPAAISRPIAIILGSLPSSFSFRRSWRSWTRRWRTSPCDTLPAGWPPPNPTPTG